MRVQIQTQRMLLNSVYYGGCSKAQRYWWLWSFGKKRFVDIGNRYAQGNKPLCVELDLPAGVYELGVGPGGIKGIRHKFEVPEEDHGTDYVVVTV